MGPGARRQRLVEDARDQVVPLGATRQRIQPAADELMTAWEVRSPSR